ncbi:hypothetical protein PsorP6_014429 [Peronosclerospora sorghi]|uniref:Uncharacterized protein n=1 Tax=Peronosclerospora sorghi TaxID=230839 RepID=A0ACC0VHC8_9STRA|nr:hypothetical protein PsorP6_014429 [Peronosclerospora sorghi]
MSIDESSVLVDRALVTMCQDLPESLGLYNTAKDKFSLEAIRSVPLLELVGPNSRKLALIRDWMRSYEPAVDQPLSTDINMDTLMETSKRERKERERELQLEKHAKNVMEKDEKKKRKEKKRLCDERKRVEEKVTTKEKKDSEKSKSNAKRKKRRMELELDDDDELMMDESSSTNNESSLESSSSSESDSDRKAKKRKKTSGNLPPIEEVLSSDEDEEEPNEMFDTDDPDVYEVENILRKKKAETFGGEDLYEVKWEGYEETTWEPAGNISKDLIDEFEGQPVREDVYTVQEIVDRRSKRDPSTKLKTHQYKVKWVGYDELTWEPAENLPHNLRRKFDQKYESRKRRQS